MQKLWQLRVNWDEPLPKDVSDKWLKYKKCLPRLNKLLIPRMIIGKQKVISIDLARERSVLYGGPVSYHRVNREIYIQENGRYFDFYMQRI